MAESYTKKLVFSFGVLFICLALANILGYALRLLLARSLSPAEYGLIYAVMGLFGFISFAQSLGLSEALVQMVPGMKTAAERKRALLTVMYTQLAVTAIILILAVVFAGWLANHYFHNLLAEPLVIIYALSIFLSPLEFALLSFFQGMGRTTWYGYLSLVRAAVLFAFVYAAIALGFGIIGAVLAYVLMYLLLPFVYLPLLFKLLPEFRTTTTSYDKKVLGKMFTFGAPMLLAATAGVFLTYIDTFFLTLFRSLTEVGLYNIALPTAGFLWFFSGVIYTITFPLLSEINAAKTGAVLKEGIGRMYLYLLILIMPLAVVLLFFPDIIINALFGGEYIAAARTLQILVIGGLIYSFVTLNNAILAGTGDSRSVLRATVLGAAVNVVLDIIFIPKYGIEGSAFATLVAFVVMLVMTIVEVRKGVQFHLDVKRMLLLILAGCVLGLELHYVRTLLVLPLLEKIIVALLCAGISYIILLFLFRILTRKELQLLKKQLS
jgi:O-antigen/teichoic acid export membrane protein